MPSRNQDRRRHWVNAAYDAHWCYDWQKASKVLNFYCIFV